MERRVEKKKGEELKLQKTHSTERQRYRKHEKIIFQEFSWKNNLKKIKNTNPAPESPMKIKQHKQMICSTQIIANCRIPVIKIKS